MSIFGKHVAQKPYPLMTSFFQTVIWSISRHRTVIKMTFLESWDQTGSETYLFWFKNTSLKIWRFLPEGWPDPPLSWTFLGSDCKMDSNFDFYVQNCLENMWRMPQKDFFEFGDISWPVVTWPLPWPVLSMTLMLTGYL